LTTVGHTRIHGVGWDTGGHDVQAVGVNTSRVLVVDDEETLAGLVTAYLSRAGFDTAVAHTGPDAVRQAREFAPDVIVLDLGLPGFDGVEVCRQVRQFSDCYIVMLTARDEEIDKLIGLSIGADDYVTKPFSVRELVARVQVMLRRPRGGDPGGQEQTMPARSFGDLRIDPAGRQVFINGEEVQLTRTEFDVLAALAARPAMAFSRRQLVDVVWGEGWLADDHLVDVHVAHLRRKLGDDPADPKYVSTVRGVGYRMGTGQ
jgi:DNA-binding response OmpR family regulator